MKLRTLFLSLASVALISAAAHAQNTSNTTVQEGATIAQPLVLTNYGGLFFGGIIESGNTSNVTVTITGRANTSQLFTQTYGTGAVAYTGSAISYTHPSIAGFTVTGEPSMNYSISYPSSSSVTSGANSMSVTDFAPVAETVNGVTPSGHLSGYNGETTSSSDCGFSGADAWCIGGTLHVGVNQPSGVYTGSFTVTITYN
jgi:hypothetical protein